MFRILFKLLFSTTIVFSQPHIIIIIADDLGYNDIGFRGSNQSATPNIDALAFNGIILDRFYTQQSCTPSRAALLTGKYPFKIGMQGIPISAGENRFLPKKLLTLPQALKQLDYTTHLIGKWHLGSSYKDVTPTERGFDTHFGYWHGYIGYFNYFASTKYQNITGLDLHDGFKPIWSLQGNYATKVFTEKAIEFIENYNETKPYFLMISHLAPHAGYKNKMEVPDLQETNRKYSYIPNINRRLSIDTVNHLDWSVGKIIKTLSARGHLGNSIIMFLSDNGAQTFGEHENFGSNWPLRGLKFTLFEGAVRGTAIIYSSLFKQTTGFINSELMHITDLFPTFYAAAGGNISNLPQIDGINQWDVLTQNQPTTRTEIVLEIDELEKVSAFINKRYKLINGTIFNGIYDANSGESGREFYNPAYNVTAVLQSDTNLVLLNSTLTENKIFEIRKQLDLNGCNGKNFTHLHCTSFCMFDLFDDPCETKDISLEQPEIFEKMRRKLGQFWKEVIPHVISEPQENANPKYYNNTWVTWMDN